MITTTMYRSDASESFKEHLHRLPNEVQRKFLENLINYNPFFQHEYQKKEFKSMWDFIIGAFVFYVVPEGSDYWYSIIDQYEYNVL
jgi:hypothetical protein